MCLYEARDQRLGHSDDFLLQGHIGCGLVMVPVLLAPQSGRLTGSPLLAVAISPNSYLQPVPLQALLVYGGYGYQLPSVRQQIAIRARLLPVQTGGR